MDNEIAPLILAELHHVIILIAYIHTLPKPWTFYFAHHFYQTPAELFSTPCKFPSNIF